MVIIHYHCTYPLCVCAYSVKMYQMFTLSKVYTFSKYIRWQLDQLQYVFVCSRLSLLAALCQLSEECVNWFLT